MKKLKQLEVEILTETRETVIVGKAKSYKREIELKKCGVLVTTSNLTDEEIVERYKNGEYDLYNKNGGHEIVLFGIPYPRLHD